MVKKSVTLKKRKLEDPQTVVKPKEAVESKVEAEQNNSSESESGSGSEDGDEQVASDGDSASEGEEEEEGSGVPEDDEFLGSDDEEEDEEDEEDEQEEAGKKRKRNPQESFSTAISAILGSKVKAHNRDNPILLRAKKSAKELETSKLEAKAKRAMAAEKKLHQDKARVRDILPKGDDAAEQLEYERQLKQFAKQGVVRLFNAVLGTQTTETQQSEKHVLGLTKKEEQINEMSKDKFLDLIRSSTR